MKNLQPEARLQSLQRENLFQGLFISACEYDNHDPVPTMNSTLSPFTTPRAAPSDRCINTGQEVIDMGGYDPVIICTYHVSLNNIRWIYNKIIAICLIYFVLLWRIEPGTR